LTLNTWLAMWSMLAFYDYKTTLRYLAYLGYGIVNGDKKMHEVPSVKETITITKLDIENKLDTRNIFLCYIFGTTGSGKHNILRNFVNNSTADDTRSAHRSSSKGNKHFNPSNFAVNEVSNGKYLIYEIPGDPNEQSLSNLQLPSVTRDRTRMLKAHLFMLVYDNSDSNSWKYAKDLYLNLRLHFPHIPCMFVATKCDLQRFKRDQQLDPETFCISYRIPRPIQISDKDDVGSIYPLTMERILEIKRPPRSSVFFKITVFVVCAVVMGGYVTHKYPTIQSRLESLFRTLESFFSSIVNYLEINA